VLTISPNSIIWLPVKVLSRTWQMLLKGIPEVQAAPRPVSAGEMVLIRIAHAATLPTLDEALKMLDGDLAPSGGGPEASGRPQPGGSGGGANAVSRTQIHGNGGAGGHAMRLVEHAEPVQRAEPVAETVQIPVRSLADIAALATENRDIAFKTLLRRCVRLVRIEPGKIEISLTDDAPRDLANQIGERLKRWTGRPWFVALSREPGGATLAEEDDRKREGQLSDAKADPAVAALLAKFPGAKIIDIRMPDAPGDADDATAPVPMADPGIGNDDDDEL
jgi:DNA polymerase-3 subunit gamma/tau